MGYVTVKDSKYLNINCVNSLYLIINKVNGYVEKIKNKYLMLVPTNEIKKIIKKQEKLQSKIRDLISSITKNTDDYNEIYLFHLLIYLLIFINLINLLLKSKLIQMTCYL